MSDKQKKSGFEDDPSMVTPCYHPDHNPPMHLVIPAGKRYRHVCPGCGKEIVITSNSPMF
jgi:hypothetical protein